MEKALVMKSIVYANLIGHQKHFLGFDAEMIRIVCFPYYWLDWND